MKRWTLRILLCLILGAITTVAVAWGCGCRSDLDESSYRFAVMQLDGSSVPLTESWEGQPGPPGYQVHHAEGFGIEEFGIGRLRVTRFAFHVPVASIWPDWAGLSGSSAADVLGHDANALLFFAQGWPARALWCAEGPALDDMRGGLYLSPPPESIPISGPVFTRHVLAFRPSWPGFLIDTLFYAAIWFGVFFGFTSAKRFIRVKRGRCPRCGYDLRGGVISDKRLAIRGDGAASTAGCPECGWNREESMP